MLTLRDEEWRSVSPNYQVSNLGRVRRLHHVMIRSNGRPFTKPEMIMNGGLEKDGYRQVRIEGRLMMVHALVAAAFIGPRPDGMEVCHEDGNKLNCRLDNLRYDTHSNNVLDSVRHGTHRMIQRKRGAA